MMKREGYEVVDYVAIPTTVTEVPYFIGTNAFLADPTGLPTLFMNPHVSEPLGRVIPGFTAQEILFYATNDCWVRFNWPTRLSIRIIASSMMTFHQKVHTIYVRRVSADGTLHVWAEG